MSLRVRYYRQKSDYNNDLEFDLQKFDEEKASYFFYENKKLKRYSTPIGNDFSILMYSLIQRLKKYYQK